MVQFRTFFAVLTVAATAVSAVPVRRGDSEMGKSMDKPMESMDKPMESMDKPMEEKPMESMDKPMEEKPMESMDKPMEEKPMEEKPYEAPPMEEKPMEEMPMEEKPMEAPPMMEEKPMEAPPMMEEKPMEAPPPPPAEYMPSTEAAKATEAAPAYGSGSMDKSGYNDCVSQCMSQFGGGSAAVYTPAAAAGPTEGSKGEGATHMVIVAPSQGVLRYVPPFVDAAPGDTVMFKWGANNHTVTKSSALLPCNKTADSLFTSGSQNKDFTFTQKVNDTTPTWFYCNTPGHCPKGMFGGINLPKAATGGANSSSNATSAGSWMAMTYGSANSTSNSSAAAAPAAAPAGNSSAAAAPAANSSKPTDMASYYSYTQSMVANNAAASTWGDNVDLAALPDWARPEMAGNIMYMKNLIAMNPDVVGADGKVTVGGSDAPMMLPNDVPAVNGAASADATGAAAASGSTPAAAGAAGATGAAAPAGAAATGTDASSAAQSQPNGASAVTSSKLVMGATVVLATFFLL